MYSKNNYLRHDDIESNIIVENVFVSGITALMSTQQVKTKQPIHVWLTMPPALPLTVCLTFITDKQPK